MHQSKLPMGNYSVISVLGGRDADKYQIEHLKNENGAIFKVLDKWSAIPAPYIVSVEFIYDYTAVYIGFSAPTNMANLDVQFPCDELFEFTSPTICESHICSCTWIDSSTIAITRSSLVLGSRIELRGNKIGSDCPPEIVRCKRSTSANYTVTLAESGNMEPYINRILKRYDIYMKETKPVLDFYSSHKGFHEIDGSLEIDEITGKIGHILNV